MVAVDTQLATTQYCHSAYFIRLKMWNDEVYFKQPKQSFWHIFILSRFLLLNHQFF